VNPKLQTKSKEADPSLSSFMGENYEYIRTIVSNSIEIKKLEFLDQSSNWVGKIIVGIILAIILVLLSVVLLIISAILINMYIENWLITTGILAIILIAKAIIVHFFIRHMVYRKINKKLLSLVN